MFEEKETFLKPYLEEVDKIAQDIGLPCGLPAALFIKDKEVGLQLSPYFSQLAEEFKKRLGNCQENGVETVEPKGEELPKKRMWKLHTSWLTSCQWKGRYGTVHVLQNLETGKFMKAFLPLYPEAEALKFMMRTFAITCSLAVEEAELRAQEELGVLLSPEQKSQYLLTGMFIEVGKSGVTYFLRKGRPTIATRHNTKSSLCCALCLHPIGYYRESFSGVLTPTDEIITHLTLIRSNEHRFWKKANQHPPRAIQSGIF